MKFKAKLRTIGNSIGIYVPREAIGSYNVGDEVEFDTTQVITAVNERTEPLIKKPFNLERCNKHAGAYKGTCGCT
ncbi:hypothetical protein M0R04_13125 [Candidatus Dojkabacteria bacterium]|jgi:hypothetical protein|nr:hypothetical protein [Candidatus Dojkabacteria bacterium]